MKSVWRYSLLFSCLLALHSQAAENDVVPYDPVRPEGMWYYNPAAFNEPKIAEVDDKIPTIRFFWIRTFHRPVCIRVFKDGEGPKIRVIRCAGKGGYEWGSIESDKTIPLSDEQWKSFVDQIKNPDVFAPLRNLNHEEKMKLMGLDGSMWVIESKIDGKLTYAMVWSPGTFVDEHLKAREDLPKQLNIQPFFDYGLTLLQVSGILEPVY
jgi:hypothetical protein